MTNVFYSTFLNVF